MVARDKIAHLMAGQVEAVADNRHGGGRRFARQLLQVADPCGHGLEELAIELGTTGDQLAKIRGIEPAHARGLERAQARHRRRSQE